MRGGILTMMYFQPFEVSARFIRASGTLWCRNIELAQGMTNAMWRGQMLAMGLALPRRPEPARPQTAGKVAQFVRARQAA